MSTYPPAAPTLTDNDLSASRFLKNPNFVARRLRTLAEQRYIGGLLLSGRQDASGGAVGYEQIEGIFADAEPEVVAPGSEYTLTTIQDGPAGIARVVKSGKDAIVTDESVARRNMDPVEKALNKLGNSQGRAIDAGVVSLIASAVTASRAAETAWNADGATILRDILRAVSDVRALGQGYEPNTLLVDDATWAYLASDPVISAAMAREDRTNPVYTGRFSVLAGLEVMVTSAANLPGGTGSNAWVLDRTQLGFIATEDLGGGYQQVNDLIQSKVIRLEENDGWRLRARSNFAPVVTDPGAGFKITGVMP